MARAQRGRRLALERREVQARPRVAREQPAHAAVAEAAHAVVEHDARRPRQRSVASVTREPAFADPERLARARSPTS